MKQQPRYAFSTVTGESYAIQRPCCHPVNECSVRSTVIKHTAEHVAFWPQPVGSLPLAQNAWHCTSIAVEPGKDWLYYRHFPHAFAVTPGSHNLR